MMVFPEDNHTWWNSQTTLQFTNCQNLSSMLTPFTKTTGWAMLVPYMVVGLPANLWVMWLIAHGTKDAFAAEFFFLNLAICDIFYMLGIPLHLLCMHDQAGRENGPLVLTLLKELWVFVWIGRPLFQCCICLERYLAVVRPLTFIRFKPLRFRVALSGLMWMLTIAQLFNVSNMDIGDIALPLTSFVVALSVMMFFCLSVLWSLKQTGPVDTERTGGDPMKRRAFNIILINLGIVLTGYVPVLVVLPLKDIISDHLFYDLSLGTQYLLVLCGLFQPLFYIHKAGKLTCIFKQ